VAGAIESDETTAFLVFDSRSLTGHWSDRLVRLSGDGSLTPLPGPVAQANDIGKAPDSPAAVGEVIATSEWVIQLEHAAFGQDVYDLSDFRTQAVGDAEPSLIPSWLALQFRITSNWPGLAITHLPATAFSLAYADGSEVLDVPRLTPPSPDASGDYLSGGSRSGWAAFEVPGDYDGSLIRFQPYRTDQDARFLTWGDGAAPGGPARAEPTPEPPEEQIPPGTTATVTESGVNLRAEASTEAEVLAVLDSGATLEVTGEPVEAGGFLWYPVENLSTGDQGFIAANFIRPES
jgi:hypothetical protein